MEVLQYKVLPFGSFLALGIFVWSAWSIRRPATRSLVAWVVAIGVAGAIVTVVALVAMYRLPWMFACLDCFASKPWYSYTLTSLQGFGLFSAVALAVRRLYTRHHARAA